MPVTPARRLTLAVGVPVALALIGWTALNAVAWAGPGSQRVHITVANHGTHVSAAIGSGQISFVPGAGHRISIAGIARYAIVPATVSPQVTASGVAIDSGCPVPAGRCAFHLRIVVPPGDAVTASSGAGDVSAAGLRHGANLTTEAGDVRTRGLGGRIALSTGSGDVIATGLVAVQVTATSGSGHVSLTFARVPRLVQVTDASGSITIVVPAGRTAYRVEAQTASGVTHITVPTSPSSPFVINATTASGDITIVRGR